MKSKELHLVTDCDGVLFDWAYAFDIWMKEFGFEHDENSKAFEVHERYYGLSIDRAMEYISLFNHSSSIGYLPAYKDSVEYLTKFHELGYTIDVVTSIGKDKYSRNLRHMNLKRLFGNIFNEIHYLDDFNISKKIILNNLRKTSSLWIEDQEKHAISGKELGYSCFLMQHRYNMDTSFNTIENWKELYEQLES